MNRRLGPRRILRAEPLLHWCLATVIETPVVRGGSPSNHPPGWREGFGKEVDLNESTVTLGKMRNNDISQLGSIAHRPSDSGSARAS